MARQLIIGDIVLPGDHAYFSAMNPILFLRLSKGT